MESEPSLHLPTSKALLHLEQRARALGREPIRYQAGDQILSEGVANRSLYILITGEVRLSKQGEDGIPRELDRLGPGSLLGILSFWRDEPSFSDAHAMKAVECLELDRPLFDEGVAGDPEFARLTLHLLVVNLSDRYRRVVGLNLRVASLTRDLEKERNALREAVEDLQRTRNELVHKEKLATMGQLLAGIAHEINNPSSSLLNSVGNLGRELPKVFENDPVLLHAFQEGQASAYVTTTESRERMARLAEKWPELPRSACRRLSRLSPEVLEQVEEGLAEGWSPRTDAWIRAFELGGALHSIQLADERITRLVKSLKSYSRQDEDTSSSVRVGDCIRDTLVVLNHKVKHFDLRMDLPDLPQVPGKPGEINQILTNLITNACEATAPGKRISLRAGVNQAGYLFVEISDEGHGIPEELMDRIFEPNVTTKSGGGQYGLGLGLAISRDLAMQHQGSLRAWNSPEGGAVFRLELPVT